MSLGWSLGPWGKVTGTYTLKLMGQVAAGYDLWGRRGAAGPQANRTNFFI